MDITADPMCCNVTPCNWRLLHDEQVTGNPRALHLTTLCCMVTGDGHLARAAGGPAGGAQWLHLHARRRQHHHRHQLLRRGPRLCGRRHHRCALMLREEHLACFRMSVQHRRNVASASVDTPEAGLHASGICISKHCRRMTSLFGCYPLNIFPSVPGRCLHSRCQTLLS